MPHEAGLVERPEDFIRQRIRADLDSGNLDGPVTTRFPPEPNGFLHIGHAKSIFLNSDLARENNGRFNLRFDDTNPLTETPEFVESMQTDIRWLGVQWDGTVKFASGYFEQLYEWAEELVRRGHAYVDDLSADRIREMRGTLTEPGRNSPFRDRSPEENLRLLREMRTACIPTAARC